MKTGNVELKLVQAAKKVVFAAIVGLAFFFGGLFCAVISPLIALLSLICQPKINLSTDFKKRWEDKLKEMEDPDHREKWKRDHEDLYNQDIPENNKEEDL
jgi:predicted membrane protein